MTNRTYEFTAFSESDLVSGNLSCGSTFSMPANATTCFSVIDNDRYLSGDGWWWNDDNATDSSGQTAQITIDGQEVGNGRQIYAESYYWVKDQDNNWYVMIEIEQEGTNDDYFTFFTNGNYSVPPADAQLTVVSVCNVRGNWVDFECLDAGDKEVPTGSISGRLFLDENCDGLDNGDDCVLGDNLFVNGDFEENALNNTGSSLGVQSGLTGWVDIGSAPGQVHEQNFGHGNDTGNAILELEHGVIICQEVNVQEAGDYRMSFDVTRRGNNDQNNTFQLFIDGQLHETYVVRQNQTIEIDLDLVAGNHRFDFKSLSTNVLENNAFVGAGLDNVKIQQKTVVSGEEGQAGVKVYLLDANGNEVLDENGQAITTVTDSNGEYTFDDVTIGNYRVKFEAPDGKVFTTQNVGNDDTIDSDVNAQGISDLVTVKAGQDVTDVDAGLKDEPSGSISGRVFLDENCDGLDNAENCVFGENLFVNGDFEENALNNTGSSLGVASGLTGWVDIGSAPGQVHEQDYGHGNATGNAILELEHGVIICQEVSVQEAGNYRMSFDVTRRGDNDQNNTFQLFIDGQLHETYVVKENQTIEIDLGLVAGNHRFDFKSLSTNILENNAFFGAGLDNVKLQQKTVVTGEEGQAGVKVYLLDANGNEVLDENGQAITTVTDSNGEYSFDNVVAGNYRVKFETPDGKVFTTQNVGEDDSIDSDVNAQGISDLVTVTAGQDVTDVDAGLKDKENVAPVLVDDKASTCYDDAVTVDVLANDTDQDNDTLTVTAVNGQAITEGGSAINIDGVLVKLVNGELVFDGSLAYADLIAGETAVKSFTYTANDGNGHSATAEAEVTFKGATDTLEKVEPLLTNSQIGFQVLVDDFDVGNGVGDGAYSAKLSDAGDNLNGVYVEAYCLDIFASVQPGGYGMNIEHATFTAATVTVATTDFLTQEQQDFLGTGGINGESAADNLDLINWIINQDFENTDNGDGNNETYTGAEVQGAIWALTNGEALKAFGEPEGVFVDHRFGTDENAQEIVDLALANGEGFEAGEGDLVGIYIDPVSSPSFTQPFIIGVDLYEECAC